MYYFVSADSYFLDCQELRAVTKERQNNSFVEIKLLILCICKSIFVLIKISVDIEFVQWWDIV